MAIEIRHSIEFRRKILVISGNCENRDALGGILFGEYELDYAASGAEALSLLPRDQSPRYALSILDLDLPDMDAFDLMRDLRDPDRAGRVPVIAIMDHPGREAVTLRAGATDFIRKPFQEEVILARCERIIELSMDQSLIRLAQDDPLTGLYNRTFFFEYVRQIENSLDNPVQDAAVLNIEHFHLINELYGREYGNQVLIRLADGIRRQKARTESIACRVDADTFYIYCKHQESYDQLLAELNQELQEFTRAQHIRIRVGVYQDVDPQGEPEVWFDRAKKACDRIREDYTRNICFYDSRLYERSIFEEKLIHDIHDAIRENRIIVYYQPKFDVSGEERRLCSAEALVRWAHPEFGLIPPDEFIPLFEKNGLIHELDHFVWEQSAKQVRLWQEKYQIDLPVSVNVSHIDLYDEHFEDYFLELIQRYNLSTEMIHLEITESTFSEDTRRLMSAVTNLREKGFQVEMDDFGSGYSSLNMLCTLPFDVLKLDRQFIRTMMENEKGLRTVELILDLTRFLNVRSIAEGVETEEEYQILKKLKCDIIQGYYFSKPLSPAAFDDFLQQELGASRRYGWPGEASVRCFMRHFA